MLIFLTDENFNDNIARGLQRRRPEIDIIRVQEIGLTGKDDPAVLERAAQLGRVLLTHDVATMPDFAYARIGNGQMMPGVIVIPRGLAVRRAIEEILFLEGLTTPQEMDGRIQFLPL